MSDFPRLTIEHRINTIAELKRVPKDRGVEIDVRYNSASDRLILNHELGTGEELDRYLDHFKHAFIVFNIKEAGIEDRCIALAEEHSISSDQYFLLDVEFPYLYRATRTKDIKSIAVRFSEAEPIEMVQAQKGYVDWVWIDTNTQLPVKEAHIELLNEFKTCLVGPDRWGRPEETPLYLNKLKDMGLNLDAVMIGA